MNTVVVRDLKQQDYFSVWQAMREFTDQRTENSDDEIWLVEHPPVYTLGQSGKTEYLLNPGDIPVIKTDRGGQVTYHGPGQQLVYVLLNIQRRKLGVRQLVSLLEQSVIDLLAHYNITATTLPHAPGVYVDTAKICSVGLRIRRGCSYHGLALNVAMDLTPFAGIHPCGYPNLKMIQLSDLGGPNNLSEVSENLVQYFLNRLVGSLNMSSIITSPLVGEVGAVGDG